MGNIRYAAFARLSDGLTLASFKGKGATPAVTETANKVLRSGNLKPNGQLTVTSRLGEGTSVSLYFPCHGTEHSLAITGGEGASTGE